MIRRPPRSTQSRSSAASDVYKRQPASSTAAMTPHASASPTPRSTACCVSAVMPPSSPCLPYHLPYGRRQHPPLCFLLTRLPQLRQQRLPPDRSETISSGTSKQTPSSSDNSHTVWTTSPVPVTCIPHRAQSGCTLVGQCHQPSSS